MIKIIIRGRNCEKYLIECLNSIRVNAFDEWQAYIILDNPEDRSAILVKAFLKLDSRFNLQVNKKQYGVAANIWKGIKFANPKPEDIIAIVDADDTIRSKSLGLINDKYLNNSSLLLTHGSFYRMDKKRSTKTSRAYSPNKPVRKQSWRASHLKTFKFKLFQHFQKEWLKDANGNWLQAASDVALMMPLIELAGFDRIKFIKQITYEWRMTSQKTRGHVQKRNKDYVMKQKPLKRLGKV